MRPFEHFFLFSLFLLHTAHTALQSGQSEENIPRNLEAVLETEKTEKRRGHMLESQEKVKV